MASEMGLFEAMYTMRAIRKFKPDPVPDDVLRQVLEAAGQAPSGGNRQPWRFIVIRSKEGKKQMSEIALQAQQRAEEARRTGADRRPVPVPGTGGGGGSFAEMLADVPVIVIVCAQRPASEGPWTVGPFGQTYPAVQNLLLAARALGLGGTITTGYRWMESEVKEWLGLPEGIDSTCLVPLGYPLGTDGERHGKKTRKHIEELVYEEHWGQPISF